MFMNLGAGAQGSVREACDRLIPRVANAYRCSAYVRSLNASKHSADMWLRSAAFCCRLGKNHLDASGRYNGTISVHHPEFTRNCPLSVVRGPLSVRRGRPPAGRAGRVLIKNQAGEVKLNTDY